MASKISDRKSKAVPLTDFVTDIERRRAETGITDLPRNSGARRTESKKVLLEAIRKSGGKW